MAEKMTWKECTEQNIITKTEQDRERALQMKNMAQLRLEFWNKDFDERSEV